MIGGFVTYHGSNSWMMLSNRMTANRREEKPEIQASRSTANVISELQPAVFRLMPIVDEDDDEGGGVGNGDDDVDIFADEDLFIVCVCWSGCCCYCGCSVWGGTRDHSSRLPVADSNDHDAVADEMTERRTPGAVSVSAGKRAVLALSVGL